VINKYFKILLDALFYPAKVFIGEVKWRWYHYLLFPIFCDLIVDGIHHQMVKNWKER
jgi:hypothetical protein